VFNAGGIGRKISIFRLPDENKARKLSATVTVPLRKDMDNAVYIRATTEDGCYIYSSPVYVIND
jgi:hypothetical protein